MNWGAKISKPIIFYNGLQHYVPTCRQGQQMWICTLLYLNILGTIDFNIEVNTNLSIGLLYEYETYCQIEEDLC
jgi:hypothetical protein